MGRRAVSAEQKDAKREAILRAARELFAEVPFERVTMIDVARRCGIAKGTTYLYVRTKEELFIALLREDYREWVEALASELARPENRHSIPRVVALLARTLSERTELIRLIALLHTTLERNVDAALPEEFAAEREEAAARIGTLFEENLTFLNPGEGALFVRRLHPIIVGHAVMAAGGDTFEAVAPALGEIVTVMLIGLKGRGQKFKIQN